MIFVTGDCHCKYNKFSNRNFPDQEEMTKNDYVIVCGDFGLWDDSKEMKYELNLLDSRRFTTLWVDGNHENYDLLATYPVEEWHGGKVQMIRPSVIHLMRGQVYDIDGKTCFTFGGARSHDISDGILEMDPDGKWVDIARWMRKRDKYFRVNHLSWWKEEMPNDEEFAEGRANLEKVNYDVDFVFTHCAPSSVGSQICYGHWESDPCTNYLQEVYDRLNFKKWYFGHYHEDAPYDDKMICLYHKIEQIN